MSAARNVSTLTEAVLESPKQGVREVGVRFRESTVHRVPLATLVKERVDTSEEAYSADLANYFATGLSSAYARKAMFSGGRNVTASPQNCPAWLCCILPCLDSTPTMKRWRECVADEAKIVRGGRQMRIDADSLVIGDVVSVAAGDVCPADLRLVEGQGEASRTAMVPQLRKAFAVHAREEAATDGTALDAPNVLYGGFRLDSGAVKGIVVATGENSLVSKLVAAGHF